MKNQKIVFERNVFKTILMMGVSLIFALFFMWFALKDIHYDKIKQSLIQANYFWMLFSAIFAILAYGFRAVRWNLLLEPMGYRILNLNAFWTIAFGYMVNLTIPRSGEIARATALYGVEKIPVEKSFATIVIERVVDLCFMLFFLLFTFIFNGKVLKLFFCKLTSYQSNGQRKLSSTDEFLSNMGVGDLDVFYFWLKIGTLTLVILAFTIGLTGFKEKIFSLFKGVLEGLLSVFRMKSRLRFLLYSVGIWLCYFLSAYLICFALEETSFFRIGDGFLIIIAGTLGMMVPTSGGAGSFHVAVKLAIAGIFVSLGRDQNTGEEVGLTYALISHTIQMIFMLIMGLIAIPFLIKSKNRSAVVR